MTAEQPSKRDRLVRLFDSGRVEGVAYLFAIIVLGRASVPELVDLSGDERHRVARYLHRLESRGFVMCSQAGNSNWWHPTPLALELFGFSAGQTVVDFLPPPSSSSSDQIRSDQSDQKSRSEEEEERWYKKHHLARHYGFTGQIATRLVEDSDIEPEDVIAWMFQVGQMKRDGFQFRRSPEAYALACLLRHDWAPDRAYTDVDRYIEILIPARSDETDEEERGDENEQAQ